jgi:hypothetical protein
MMKFKVLSNTFDEERMIGPTKTDRIKIIYKKFDEQLTELNKLGADKTEKERAKMYLFELLQATQDMNVNKAKQKYTDFVKETESRVFNLIQRLRNHYNLGSKLNAINRQSKLKKHAYSEQRKAKGLKPVNLLSDT